MFCYVYQERDFKRDHSFSGNHYFNSFGSTVLLYGGTDPILVLWGRMDRMSFRNGELREEDRRVKKQQGVLD